MAVDSIQTPGNVRKVDHLFGEFLMSKGLINQSQLDEALKEQHSSGKRLGDALRDIKMLTDEQVTAALAEHLNMDYICIDDVSKVDTEVARMLPETVAKRFGVIATGKHNGRVVVAMSDPLNVVATDTVSLKVNRPIKVVLSSAGQISKLIDAVYHGSDVEEQHLRDLAQDDDEAIVAADIEDDDEDTDLISEQEAAKAPVIRFVNLLLSQASKSRASDIHIEPQEKTMKIRMRVDGVLRDMVPPARHMQAAVIARIKILSSMDIAERRLPQDGRFKMKTGGRKIDVRVSSIPTIYGEKIVMRVLDSSAANQGIDELGFEPELLEEYRYILSQPHGIIVVTGPTGSGKSTTLYSSLRYLNDPTKNITTVEDPVEYRLKGINQIQVKPDIDLTFASSLRAILRQDPDIILIGEIRDKETVDIAIKASLTGHLVLSTFHTNDAPSAVSRLVYMGVEPFLLASTLNLVIAQRLVRKLCKHCKEPVELDEKLLRKLNISSEQAQKASFYKEVGCNICGDTGYSGRLPIFEFMVMDKQMREILIAGGQESQLRNCARDKGYGGLLESGISKVVQGLTTPEEVFKVAFAEYEKQDE